MAKRGKGKKSQTITVNSAGEAMLSATPERLKRFGDDAGTFQTDTGRQVERLDKVNALFSKDLIGGDAFMAAAIYLQDAYDTGMFKSGVVDLSSDRVDGGGSHDAFNAKKIDATARFAKANAYMAHKPRIYAVALSEMILSDMPYSAFAIKHMAGNPRSGSVGDGARSMLVKALNALAGAYGPDIARRPLKTRSYIADGARPMIHPFQDEAA